jgi:glucose-1-phosphate thymidylyltransferase
MEIVGVIPAAGHATRVQPIDRSKEMLIVDGRPVMDNLVDRMRAGGATRLRVVTRPDKTDVIAHGADIGAEVVLATPPQVSASFAAGMADLADDDIVLLGFPDTLWEPEDGFQPLVEMVANGCEAALGLFRIDSADLSRSDVVVCDSTGRVLRIDVKHPEPVSDSIWGCAAARVVTMSGLAASEYPGHHFDLLSRARRDIRAVPLSDVWVDIGTREALARVYAHHVGDRRNAAT